jgi:hypothetical protein
VAVRRALVPAVAAAASSSAAAAAAVSHGRRVEAEALGFGGFPWQWIGTTESRGEERGAERSGVGEQVRGERASI